LFPLPTFSGSEGPVNQVDKPDFFFPSLSASRFLGARMITPFLAGLEGPRHPANQVVLMTPHSTGKSNSRQCTVYKTKQFEAMSGNLDQNCC